MTLRFSGSRSVVDFVEQLAAVGLDDTPDIDLVQIIHISYAG
jgi:hypothetical protein